jgi:hypothetical protein
MTAEIGTKDRARRWTFGNDTGALAERALAADPVDWQKMARQAACRSGRHRLSCLRSVDVSGPQAEHNQEAPQPPTGRD